MSILSQLIVNMVVSLVYHICMRPRAWAMGARQIFLVHVRIKAYLTKFLKFPYSPFNIVCVGELVQEWPAGCSRLQGQPASLRQPRNHRRQGLRQGFLQVCGLLGCDIPTI